MPKCTSPRFSKATLRAFLDAHIERIQKEQKFDPRNGTAQLRGSQDLDRVVDYGRKEAFQTICEAFDL